MSSTLINDLLDLTGAVSGRPKAGRGAGAVAPRSWSGTAVPICDA